MQDIPDIDDTSLSGARPAVGASIPPLSFRQPLALCICGSTTLAIWGRNLAERLRHQFAQAGIGSLLTESEARAHRGPLILVRADSVIDAPLIAVIRDTRGLLLMTENDGPTRPLAAHIADAQIGEPYDLLTGSLAYDAQPGLIARTPSQLKADFWKVLRKRETPYAVIATQERLHDIEWRSFMGTYKGGTDVVTKYVWPVPAFHATRFLASIGISPNFVTLIGAVLVFVVFWLFRDGHYGWGLSGAWLMTFLDTVDGKLARTTLAASKWGDILDHGLDLIHPPFWYVAWALGLGVHGFMWSQTTFWIVIAAILAGYVLQRLMEGIAIKWLGLEIHIWRPIDTQFRLITARRNPNLIILTLSVLLGRPDLGLIGVAVWTVLCLILHGLQLAQGFAAQRRDGALVSWMTKPAK